MPQGPTPHATTHAECSTGCLSGHGTFGMNLRMNCFRCEGLHCRAVLGGQHAVLSHVWSRDVETRIVAHGGAVVDGSPQVDLATK